MQYLASLIAQSVKRQSLYCQYFQSTAGLFDVHLAQLHSYQRASDLPYSVYSSTQVH